MAHINGRPDIPVGYFHAADDATKTATALRASYNPSLSDRITNRLARANHPKQASFVNTVRQFALSRRENATTRKLAVARERFDALARSSNTNPEQLDTAQHAIDRYAHMQQRLGDKRTLGALAAEGELDSGVEQLTAGLQEKLSESGYVPLAGLRETAHAREQSNYLVSRDDGHRIKVNTESPPRLARMIANSVSAGYDRGSTGPGRAMRSVMQHALVGVYSAEQSIKGMAAKRLAGSAHLDVGAAARMDVRGLRSTQNRTLMRAALGGNVELNQAYAKVLDEQADNAIDRINKQHGPDYALLADVGGIKPPQVRFVERRVNEYFQPRTQPGAAPNGVGTASEAPREPTPASAPQARRGASIARFAVKLLDLRSKAIQHHHAGAARHAANSVQASADPAQRARLGALQARHEAGVAKAQYGRAVRRSLLQGQLLDTLADPGHRKLLETAFAPLDVGPAGHDQPDQPDGQGGARGPGATVTDHA